LAFLIGPGACGQPEVAYVRSSAVNVELFVSGSVPFSIAATCLMYPRYAFFIALNASGAYC